MLRVLSTLISHSRDDLLLEAVRYTAQKRINLLKKLLVSFPKAKQKLKVLLKANEEMADTSPELFLMSYSLLLSTHSNIKKKATSEFFKSYLDLVQEIIEEGIENNEFKKCDSRILALSIILTQDLGDIFDRIDNGIIKRKKVRREILKLIEKN